VSSRKGLTLLSVVLGLGACHTPRREPQARPARCPALVQSLAAAPTFDTIVGASGCVTEGAEAFLVILDARDVDGLRVLAKSPSAGAQLYALCGLTYLHAEPDATTLRQELLGSSRKTAIVFGDEGPATMTPVSDLVLAKAGQPQSDLDARCDLLVSPRARPHRRTCLRRNAPLTCT